MPRPFKSLKPGEQLSASEFNRSMAEVERLANVTSSPPLEVTSNATGGCHVRFVDTEIWAEITDRQLKGISSSSSGSEGSSSSDDEYVYAWEERDPDGEGGWLIKTGARSGTFTVNPAYEINGKTVEIGQVVRIRPGSGAGEYVFSHCCLGEEEESSSSSSESSDSDSSSGGEEEEESSNSGSGFPESDCPIQCIDVVTNTECIDGELVVTKKSLVWGPLGFCLGDDPCPQSSSSSVSGGGPPIPIPPGGCFGAPSGLVSTACCPALPERWLKGSWSNINPPSCLPCMNRVCFEWNGAAWVGSAKLCGKTCQFSLSCTGSGWELTGGCIIGNALQGSGGTCNPLQLQFSMFLRLNPPCGIIDATMTITI